jgi:hypothetical protein
MADRIVVALPDGRWLALDRDSFEAGLAAGANAVTGISPSPAIVEPLLDPEQTATLLGVTARWLEDSARAELIPHYKLGRFIRFRVSEVARHCRAAGAEIPQPTDHQSVARKNRFMSQ